MVIPTTELSSLYPVPEALAPGLAHPTTFKTVRKILLHLSAGSPLHYIH